MEKKLQTIDLESIKRRIDAHELPQQQPSIGNETARANIEQALSLSESLLLEIAELMTMTNQFIDEAVSDEDISAKLVEARKLLHEAGSTFMPASYLSAMIGILLTSDSQRMVRNPLIVASIIISNIERLKKGTI